MKCLKQVKETLAVSGTTMKATVWTTAPQEGSLAPKIVSQVVPMTLMTSLGGYKIYQAIAVNHLITDGAVVAQAKLANAAGTVLQASTKEETSSWGTCETTPLTDC